MQIIFLLLSLSLAFAQKGAAAGEQCDPVQVETECFNLLCSQTPKKLIPHDQNELQVAASNHPYELHPEIKEGFDSLVNLGRNVRETTEKILREGKHLKIADDFINSPVEGMRQLEYLFEGDLKCVYHEDSCTIVANSLSNLPEGLKTLYKNLSESTYIFRESAVIPLKDKKTYFLKALQRMEGIKSSDFIKAERRKIISFKQEINFLFYSTEATWLGDYVKLVAQENEKFKASLAESIKIKMEQILAADIGSKAAKDNLIQSCRTSSFIQTTLDNNVSPEKFEEKKKKIIDSFKTKFLPALSESSGKELLGILSSDPFSMININASFHPYSPNLSVHRNGYVSPQTSFDVIRDLSLLNQAKSFKCNIGGKLVGDSFNYGNGFISVSKFVLANGYGDAMTHELGHWLSAQIKDKKMSGHSREKLLRVRKCVLENYPTDKSKPQFLLHHKGDKFRTEEDFADWFAAKAGPDENGLFCDLKKLSITLGGQGTENSYLPKAGDSHSNYLFREMNLRLNRGEVLPQSCKDLMDVYPESAPQKCDI